MSNNYSSNELAMLSRSRNKQICFCRTDKSGHKTEQIHFHLELVTSDNSILPSSL